MLHIRCFRWISKLWNVRGSLMAFLKLLCMIMIDLTRFSRKLCKWMKKQKQDCDKCKPKRIQYNLGPYFSYLPDRPKISNERHCIQSIYTEQFENEIQNVLEIRQATANSREKFRHQTRQILLPNYDEIIVSFSKYCISSLNSIISFLKIWSVSMKTWD